MASGGQGNRPRRALPALALGAVLLLTAGSAWAAPGGGTGGYKGGGGSSGIRTTSGRYTGGGYPGGTNEQDAEGSHVLEQDIVARPDADIARLRYEAVAEVAVVGNVPDEQVKDITPVSFDGAVRAAALDRANIDGRFDPDVLEASARRAVAAWAEAVVRGPALKSLRIARIDTQGGPPTMTVEAEITGRRQTA